MRDDRKHRLVIATACVLLLLLISIVTGAASEAPGLLVIIILVLFPAILAVELPAESRARRNREKEINKGTVIYLSGDMPNLTVGKYYNLFFSGEGIVIYRYPELVKVAAYEWQQILDATVDGVGKSRHTGGFVGGGVGVEGAVVGMAAASALNALTSRVVNKTTLSLTLRECEASFGFVNSEPTVVTQLLMPWRAMKRRCALPVQMHLEQDSSNIASQLAQLDSLHRSGAITDQEFLSAKNKILE